jgi:predicted transcriptional regulator
VGKKPVVGAQELALLRYVAQHGPLTVGEAAEQFGEPRELARSTVLTMMERLREKGHLTRKRVDGVFQYASPVRHDELMADVVGEFVETALDGSVTPFVAYLADTAEVSDAELAQLEELVAHLQSKRKG